MSLIILFNKKVGYLLFGHAIVVGQHILQTQILKLFFKFAK